MPTFKGRVLSFDNDYTPFIKWREAKGYNWNQMDYWAQYRARCEFMREGLKMASDEQKLTHKTGSAKDLEDLFEEALTEFAEQIAFLTLGSPSDNPEIYQVEIAKTKQRLLDAVSSTVIMDPT